MQCGQEATCASRSQALHAADTLNHTSYVCVDCSAGIIRPDHAAWQLLDSLGCQCPTHMVRQGFLMLTLLAWGLGGEAVLRDLPAQRHSVLPATWAWDPQIRQYPSNRFQDSPLNTQSSSHRNFIFRALLQDYRKMLVNYRHTPARILEASLRRLLPWVANFLGNLWRKKQPQ